MCQHPFYTPGLTARIALHPVWDQDGLLPWMQAAWPMPPAPPPYPPLSTPPQLLLPEGPDQLCLVIVAV